VIHSSVSHQQFFTCCVIGLSTSDRTWEALLWLAFYTRVKMQEASSERVRALKASTYDFYIYITDSHDLTSIRSTNTHITDDHRDLQQHCLVSGIVLFIRTSVMKTMIRYMLLHSSLRIRMWTGSIKAGKPYRFEWISEKHHRNVYVLAWNMTSISHRRQ
jgi:hypothetical protein